MLLQGLESNFGLQAFRPGQHDVIASVMAGHNTVAVMPTGAGKSICYQLPATLLDGVALVVSPLIALMKDQVEQLTAKNIACAFLNSTQTDLQRAEALHRLRTGGLKLLYVAPERLRSESLLELLAGRLSLFAVDEAHCISQWGHDFRPDYAQLGQIRKRLRPPRTVAVTATATPEVREDIARVLLMKDPHVFVAGFDRPNLFLEVAAVSGDADKREACLTLARRGGSGLIYCSTRKSAEALHAALLKERLDAQLYHAGMSDDDRRRAQDTFMAGKNTIAVATNAFGMGIDKSDIRFVAHAGIPRAVEAYYQEIGRAGRDGQPAHAVLLFNHADVFTQERLIEGSHPPTTLIADVWNQLRGARRWAHGLASLANHVGAGELEVGAAVKILERHGALERGSRGEGRWTFGLKDGVSPLQVKSADARALLEVLLGRRATPDAALDELVWQSGLGEDKVRHAITVLEKAALITVTRPFAGRTINTLAETPFEALGVDLVRLRNQERRSLLHLRRMTDYAYTKRCRRAFVLRYFGDQPPAGPCNQCDVCAGKRLAAPVRPPQAANDDTDPPPFSALAYEALRKWRRQLSQSLNLTPYLIFNDATLKNLAAALPVTRDEFLAVKGTGESGWERFGPKVVQVSQLARAAGDAPALSPLVLRKKKSR